MSIVPDPRRTHPLWVLGLCTALCACGARTEPAGIDGGGDPQLFLVDYGTGAIRVGVVQLDGDEFTVVQVALGGGSVPDGLDLTGGWRFERAFRTRSSDAIGVLAGVTAADLAESIEGRLDFVADDADVDLRVRFPGGAETRIVGTAMRRR